MKKTILTIALLICCDNICNKATNQDKQVLQYELNNGICIEQQLNN